jgi:hypothetical protein
MEQNISGFPDRDTAQHEGSTPGYSANASAFMSKRRASTHAAFFLPHLGPSMGVLDCGCGRMRQPSPQPSRTWLRKNASRLPYACTNLVWPDLE